MKVIFKYAVQTYSGEIDKMVYGSYRNDNLCLGRKFVYPEIGPQHHKLGNMGRNLAIVYRGTTTAFKADLKAYAKSNGKNPYYADKLVPSGYNMFFKMMQAWQKGDPDHVDLATITIADIVALDADIRTIKRAVDAGFLPAVGGYTALVAGIQ